MEFLVRITVRLPDDMPDCKRDELRERELREGRRLSEDGVIERIWRLPGTTSNVGIWRTADADELHDRLSALPLFPWLQVEVHALSLHPIERP